MFAPLLLVTGLIAAVRLSFGISIEDCPASLIRNSNLRVFGSSCYVFALDHEREFHTAEIECKVRGGGHLAIIQDPATQDFLYNTLHELRYMTGFVWIGLSDQQVEGQFVWVDGTPATYTHWAPGQPGRFGSSDDCVTMDMYQGGEWHVVRCGDVLFIPHRHAFICEYRVGTATTTSTAISTPELFTATSEAYTSTPEQATDTTPPPAPGTSSEVLRATSDCAPFNCPLDCGLTGYKLDSRNCFLCQCDV